MELPRGHPGKLQIRDQRTDYKLKMKVIVGCNCQQQFLQILQVPCIK